MTFDIVMHDNVIAADSLYSYFVSLYSPSPSCMGIWTPTWAVSTKHYPHEAPNRKFPFPKNNSGHLNLYIKLHIPRHSPWTACCFIVKTGPVREFVDVLLPYLTAMVNTSLAQSRLPVSQRHAIVTPLLKKTGLDSADMSNFRPVCNLSFMSSGQ